MPRRSVKYGMHDALGLDRKVGLIKVGELSADDLKTSAEIFSKAKLPDTNWPNECKPRDTELANKYGFSMDMALRNGFFVKFGLGESQTYAEIVALVLKLYPQFTGREIQHFHCEGFFAHEHDDAHLGEPHGQLMFITENDGGHSLFSRKAAKESTLVPKAGDIIFMDQYHKHALFPNQSNGAIAMIRRPLKFNAVVLV